MSGCYPNHGLEKELDAEEESAGCLILIVSQLTIYMGPMWELYGHPYGECNRAPHGPISSKHAYMGLIWATHMGTIWGVQPGSTCVHYWLSHMRVAQMGPIRVPHYSPIKTKEMISTYLFKHFFYYNA